MPRGIPNPKPETIEIVPGLPPAEEYDAYSPRHVPAPEPKVARVKLERNYRPVGEYTVVGYIQPEIKRKETSGREIIIQREEFIEGERMPPTVAGTGFADKVWAGTIISLPQDEAKAIVKAKIASLEFAD